MTEAKGGATKPAKAPTDKDKRDLNISTVAVAVFVLLWNIPEIGQMLSDGIVISRISPAVEGGVVFSELPSGAQWIFIISMAVKCLALIGTGLILSMLSWNMYKGRVFTQRNVTLLNIGTSLMLIYLAARLCGEGLGNNWASAVFGIEHWGETGTGTPLSDLTPVLLLTFAMSSAAYMLRRGAKLEEDVNGLV